MTAPNPDPKEFLELKQKLKATWMAGDFGQIAQRTAETAAAFIDRLKSASIIKPGVTVLDVACGTGNLAIPAARAGAKVIGVDIASNLIEQARQRAADRYDLWRNGARLASILTETRRASPRPSLGHALTEPSPLC